MFWRKKKWNEVQSKSAITRWWMHIISLRYNLYHTRHLYRHTDWARLVFAHKSIVTNEFYIGDRWRCNGYIVTNTCYNYYAHHCDHISVEVYTRNVKPERNLEFGTTNKKKNVDTRNLSVSVVATKEIHKMVRMHVHDVHSQCFGRSGGHSEMITLPNMQVKVETVPGGNKYAHKSSFDSVRLCCNL